MQISVNRLEFIYMMQRASQSSTQSLMSLTVIGFMNSLLYCIGNINLGWQKMKGFIKNSREMINQQRAGGISYCMLKETLKKISETLRMYLECIGGGLSQLTNVKKLLVYILLNY